MVDDLEKGLEQMLEQVGLNDIAVPLADLRRSAAKLAEGNQDLDDMGITLDKETSDGIQRDLQARQTSFNELAKLVDAGYMTRERAAQLWDQKFPDRSERGQFKSFLQEK